MPGIYERELDELDRLRREESRRAAEKRRQERIAELQQLWENCEALAEGHEATLRARGLPMPGAPGAYTPGELPRGYMAEKIATFAAMGVEFPCAVEIPIEFDGPPGSSIDWASAQTEKGKR